ncbi:MAG TPA: AzlC family ABC transporter permease, partial [Bacilli bacterium]
MKNEIMLPGPFRDVIKDRPFLAGLKSGIVIALGYIPIAIAFGLLADASGISRQATVLMSLTVFAGASQFVGINMMALGAAGWEVVMTTFILNLRHFLMTASLSQKIETGIPRYVLCLIAFGVTDETFSMASLRKGGRLPAAFLLGLNLVAFAAWNFGTWLGLLAGANLPQALQSSLGISLYAMFIGLLVP